MKIVVVLLLLVVLTIDICGAAAELTAEEEKEQDEGCNTRCLEKKLEPALCKESCGLVDRFRTASIEEAHCTSKCSEPPGPATKPCEEGCKKVYEAKLGEITASCNALCSKVDKDPPRFEACKTTCTPELILKSLMEMVQQVLKENEKEKEKQ